MIHDAVHDEREDRYRKSFRPFASEDASRRFMRTDMDPLVLGDCLVRKADQPPPVSNTDWRSEFQLD